MLPIPYLVAHLARGRHRLLLLTGLLQALLTSAAWAAQPPVATPSLQAALNPDGTVRTGLHGAFDASGYRLEYGAGGEPVLRPTAVGWNAMPGPSGQVGTDGRVRALAVIGSNIYVGGEFTLVGGLSAVGVARWDGSAWHSLGTGLANGVGGDVLAMAVVGPNLYVGGGFVSAGGQPARNVAKWDGTTWSSLGGGVNNTVYAMAANSTSVYAGGFFTEAGGQVTNRIARWDGAAWSSLGMGPTNGVDHEVLALAMRGNDLYVGGRFLLAGGQTANKVARWDGAAWHSVGTGATNGVGQNDLLGNHVKALAVLGSDLYVGGVFAEAGGRVAARHVARWDGAAWHALDLGVDQFVTSLATNGTDLYAGGIFSSAGFQGLRVSNVARWNGTAWSSLGTSNDNGVTGSVWAMAATATEVYAGGNLFATGNGMTPGIPVNNIAYYTAPTVTSVAVAAAALVAMYPNPATGRVVAVVPPTLAARNPTAHIISSLGISIRALPLAAGTTTHSLDLTGLPAGVYTLRIGSTSQRLVVK